MNNSTCAISTSGGYKRTRVRYVCTPGETYTYIDSSGRESSYTNRNNAPAYITDYGIVPGNILIWFQSEHEADIFFLKQELETTNKKLELERSAHKKTLKTLSEIRTALRKIA